MGYYCTVPQCTSLAGKTKNVKFHRFPRDIDLANKWNIILKRGKPFTKYSKVCSLHFTQADYNVTTMGKNKGQWKTLSKDAVPSQNLPKLNPDGSVMVIRKTRTVKYKDEKKKYEDPMTDKHSKWSPVLPSNYKSYNLPTTPDRIDLQDSALSYRLQKLNDLANIISPNHTQQSVSPPQPQPPSQPQTQTHPPPTQKPKKQDAIMQTDPIKPEDEELLQNGYSEGSEKSYSPDQMEQYPSQYQKEQEYSKEDTQYSKEQEQQYSKEQYPKVQSPYTKEDDYSKEQAQYSKEQGTYTKEQSQYSKEQGTYAKEQVQYSKEQGQYSKEQGQYSKEQGQYSKEQGQYSKEQGQYSKEQENFISKDDYGRKKYETPKDYTKSNEDYIPQTNEEYNKEAEKYALERKSHNGYEKGMDYQKSLPIENGYQKIQDIYAFNEKPPEFEPRAEPYSSYQSTYTDSADILRSQQHNLQILQEQHRINENQNFFNENHIKQEIDFGTEEEKFLYERSKEASKYDGDLQSEYERQAMEQRLLQQMHHVKQEPDLTNGCESVMQPQTSPYYNTNGHTNIPGGYYESARPGPELLIAKQNALAAHTQLWQNTMKRPFFYSDSSHYNAPQLLHRYEDVPRIQQ